ncbi:MAG: hypothetical protein Q4P36_07625 [Bowdeniella nasicola]|nr:hypothetical protein [Bowdeniella nasicola]
MSTLAMALGAIVAFAPLPAPVKLIGGIVALGAGIAALTELRSKEQA